MRVLIACEESGVVRDAFNAAGHYAVSCDLLPSRTTGKHYQGSIFDLEPTIHTFDLVIAHPPCTAVAVSGNRYYANTQDRLDGIAFIERIWNWPVKRLCIENPVGVINTMLPAMPRPQYIQPYQFGHNASKRTGLWMRGLPNLKPTCYIQPRIVNGKQRWDNQTDSGQNRLTPSPTRQRERSQTYAGIAEAMVKQWGNIA